MGSMKTSPSRLMRQESKLPANTPEVGLVLMDISLRVIAIDSGAMAILRGRNKPQESTHPLLPKEIVAMMATRDPHDLSSAKSALHIGSVEYNVRTYFLEATTRFPAMIVLHLERVCSTTDAISAIAAKYSLTEREKETLWGISMGLSSKELATRMKISPNTVKVFLRLIMIKMGVASRGAVIAQILQNQSPPETDAGKAFSAKA